MMGNKIVIESVYARQADRDAVSLEQWLVKRERRRKRVAKRMAKRFPLFAVQIMKEEFKDYNYEQFEADLAGKKLPKKRRAKSPMVRQGRYLAMKKALANYRQTKEVKYLIEAKRLRERMFQPYQIEFRLGKERRRMQFPSTTSIRLMRELVQISFSSWQELESILEEKTRWIHVS